MASLPPIDLGLALARQDAEGFVSVVARSQPGRLVLHLHGADPEGGLLSALGHRPMLDPVRFALDFDGPRNAEPVRVSLEAGPARAL